MGLEEEEAHRQPDIEGSKGKDLLLVPIPWDQGYVGDPQTQRLSQ